MCDKSGTSWADAVVVIFIMVLAIVLAVFWLLGFVLAKGFWSTFMCWIPMYSWYLVLEHFFVK